MICSASSPYGSVSVSTDKNKLDIPFIHHFLKNTYWAKDRTIEDVQISIDNSLCFGIYYNTDQVGFARVTSDFISFAYLMDVFIIDDHRGKGYSSVLLENVMKEPKLKEVKIWGLATLDAHFLYHKFGFKTVENPGKLMEKIIT